MNIVYAALILLAVWNIFLFYRVMYLESKVKSFRWLEIKKLKSR